MVTGEIRTGLPTSEAVMGANGGANEPKTTGVRTKTDPTIDKNYLKMAKFFVFY
jgi:hypothetical protein